MLTYQVGNHLTTEQFRDLLVRSTLGERRPIHDDACLRGMLENADLIITCRDGDTLVGIARSVTDFHFCCYLSDLAVDRDYQGRGIGKALISQTQRSLEPTCQLILLSAPAATTYYPHLGFQKHDSAWTLPAGAPALSSERVQG
ncbi:MAG: GNAT family N-acetyltransferase [Verrucomicrobiae bacterium]|nr:GNAT family N-acetyltransferase [Verrucomicrobiae bacterium]